MSGDKQKQISDILQKFNRNISRVMKVARSIEKNNMDLEWVSKVLSTLRDTNPPLVLEKCIDKFWDNRAAIMARDKRFFVDTDVCGKYIKNDERKEWLEGFVNIIKKKIDTLSEEDSNFIWDRLNGMLKCIVEYRIITKYHI